MLRLSIRYVLAGILMQHLLTSLVDQTDPAHVIAEQLRALDAVRVEIVVKRHHLALIIFLLFFRDDIKKELLVQLGLE